MDIREFNTAISKPRYQYGSLKWNREYGKAVPLLWPILHPQMRANDSNWTSTLPVAESGSRPIQAQWSRLLSAGRLLLVIRMYLEVHKLKSTTSASHRVYEATFSRFWIPETWRSGQQWSTVWRTVHTLCINIQIETHHQQPSVSTKQWMDCQNTEETTKRARDPHRTLMTHCTTLFSWCKRSPAELLMGTRLRETIPVPTTHLIPEWSYMYLSDFHQ